MKTRTILASLVAFFAGLAIAFAADPQMGTWKLDKSESKFNPGATKNHTVVYAPAAGDMVKVTVDGTDKDGKATHSEWTGKFDGKDYPVTGDPNTDSRSYIASGKHSMSMTIKKGGKVVATGKITVALDGKSRTVVTMGDNPAANNTAVYDKQ